MKNDGKDIFDNSHQSGSTKSDLETNKLLSTESTTYPDPFSNFITQDMLGVNFQAFSDAISPYRNFDLIQEKIGLHGLRFPGGIGDEIDLDDYNSHIDGREQVTTVEEFLEYAGSGSYKVTFVLPTKSLTNGTHQIEDLVEYVEYLFENRNGAEIQYLEIGNEYWSNMTSDEYGQLCNEILPELYDFMITYYAKHFPDETPPKLGIQMGMPWNNGDIELAEKLNLGWIERIEKANRDIIDQLSPDARAAIGATIEHYYFSDSMEFGGLPDSNVLINKWKFWGNELPNTDLIITEWNVDGGGFGVNQDDWGLKLVSNQLEMFEAMIECGVDAAFFWGVTGRESTRIRTDWKTDEVGYSGETLRLLSENLNGMRALDVELENLPIFAKDISVNAYGDDEENVVLFFSNRLEFRQNFEFDLSLLGVDNSDVYFEKISVDQLSSDLNYQGSPVENYWQEADTIPLVESGVFEGKVYEIELLPYEVIMLRIEGAQNSNLSEQLEKFDLNKLDSDFIFLSYFKNYLDLFEAHPQVLQQNINVIDTVVSNSMNSQLPMKKQIEGSDVLVFSIPSDEIQNIKSTSFDDKMGDWGHDKFSYPEYTDLFQSNEIFLVV